MKVSEILAQSKAAFPSLEIVPPLRGLTKDELLAHADCGAVQYLFSTWGMPVFTEEEIKKYLPMSEIYKLYPTLHEASEEKFIDVANSILERKNLPTKLQTIRKAIGLSQKELSVKSGVTLRMIQQYEQRAKDINKSTATNLFALAGALGCKAEDLLE